MTPENQQRIADHIDQAYELIDQRAEHAACLAFAGARAMAVSIADPADVHRVTAGNTAALAHERLRYRDHIAAQRSGDNTLLVLGDSLALPRPDDKGGSHFGADRTYPFLMLDRLPSHDVTSHCQRFFTTDDLLEVLRGDASLGVSSDVVIHVGLNDCANRMFLERERLALSLLPEATKDKIVGFAQKHRRVIIRHLPAYHYVDPERFRTNLDTMIGLLKARGARAIILSTIILPPERFWQATPNMQQNFSRYNLIIMEAASRHDVKLHDVDRLMWSRLGDDVLLADGMHMSLTGHNAFADAVAQLIG